MIRSVLFLAGIMTSSFVYAHGYKEAGGKGSNMELLAKSLPSLDVVVEDETGAVRCSSSEEQVECNIIQKHGRPIADLETYPLGDYMQFEQGGEGSNAAKVLGALSKAYAFGDESVSANNSNGYVRLKRDDGISVLSCTSDGTLYECRIDKVKSPQ